MSEIILEPDDPPPEHPPSPGVRRLAWLPACSQMTGMLAGVLLTRLLPKAEFAWFTIGNTAVSFFSTLVEGGTGLGIQSLGGRMWQDRPAFRSLIASALSLRWRLGFFAALLALPVPAWLLLRNGAPPAWAALILLVNVLAFPSVMTSGVLSSALKLNGRFGHALRADLWAAFGRLTLVLTGALVRMNAVLASLAGTMTYALQQWFLRRPARDLTGAPSEATPEHRAALTGQVRALLPNAMFLYLQTQVGVWLLSITASASTVADFGALMRLASVFALLSALFYHLIIPSLARCQSVPDLRRRLLQAVAGYVTATVAIAIGGRLFAPWLLWVFGPSYAHLTKELPWMLLCHGTYTLASILWWFNTSRGWVWHAWLNPVITIVIQAGVLIFYRPDTVMRLIAYLFLTITPLICIGLAEVALGLRRMTADKQGGDHA